MSGWRLPSGGLVDRRVPRGFTFDGARHSGFAGDTLASALLADGVRLMGRSFKYHRPRGLFGAGPEEPNALVELRSGARREPNTRATVAELHDGLEAVSQNRWPSLALDVMAVNDLMAPVLSAGFYYKTFMWPAALWERLYEPAIRRAAGLGRLSGEPDPDAYDKAFAHCDLLVIGAGPAGLMAALTAARAGARVVLADEDFRPGGRLNGERLEVGGQSGADWAAAAVAELAALPDVRLLTRTTVFGLYDGGTFAALERVGDHLPVPPPHQPRQRLWRIVARRSLLCAGSIERPIAFEGNDRPGVMLASAVRTYLHRYGVAAGRRATLFTCNDNGWLAARDLQAAGVSLEAVVDTRPAEAIAPAVRALAGDSPVYTRAQIVGTRGTAGLRGVRLRTANARTIKVPCDLLAVSGGWNPSVHLACHIRNRPVWDGALAAFVPGEDTPPGLAIAGAARGRFSTHAALADGAAQAAAALADLGIEGHAADLPQAEDAPFAIRAFWHVEPPDGRPHARAFVDLQNDVTVKDIRLSAREGFRAPEHMKRYTTLGMATDGGKTANVVGLALLAEATGVPIEAAGTTIYRPPYTPVAISAFAGRARGKHFKPTRLTPTHDWAAGHGASFTEAGLWLRAEWFARQGESGWRDSVDREALAVRQGVGVCDASSLGKIDVKGRDAAHFLDRLYAGTMSTLKVGRVRYGLMLREDGFVMDDGTVARLGEDHFLVTTTTAQAGPVMRHMEFCAQALWPQLDVDLVSVTDQFAQLAIAGPHARSVLEALLDDPADASNAALPYMACAEVRLRGGGTARLFRISFSGELAYEIAVPARRGEALIRAVMTAGAPHAITPYGLEALNVLRIEKGHVTGNELNGQTTLHDLGFAGMMKEGDFIGRAMALRPGLTDPARPRLVGVRPLDRTATLTAGAHFVTLGREAKTENDEGWMTSVCHSPTLGHMIGLAMIARGPERLGETMRAVDLLRGRDLEVEIVSPHFVDPAGERLRG